MKSRTWAPAVEEAARAWRGEQWVRELDEAIVRTVFEMQHKGDLSRRLHRALHDYAGRTALRQLRVQVLARLAGRRRPWAKFHLVLASVAEDRHVADLFDGGGA